MKRAYGPTLLALLSVWASAASAAPIPIAIQQQDKALIACRDAYLKDRSALSESLLKVGGVSEPSTTQIECAFRSLWFDYLPGGLTDYILNGVEDFYICCSNVSDHELVEVGTQGQNWDEFAAKYALGKDAAMEKYLNCVKAAKGPRMEAPPMESQDAPPSVREELLEETLHDEQNSLPPE